LQHIILRLPQAIARFQLQPFVDHLTSMQLIPDATKTAILQPYIGVGKGLIPSSDPNTAIGDDVCLLRVSFNSTLESLPLQLCSQPLSSNSFTIDHLGNLPDRSCALDLIPSLFFYKKAPTPIGPPHFNVLPSSLDLDLAIWFLLLIQ
jgi:hypothetical protein